MNITKGSSKINIGLIDGPVSINHPDLNTKNIIQIKGKQSATCSVTDSIACNHGTFFFSAMSLQRLCVKPGTLRHVRTPAKYLSSIKCIFNNKTTISIGTRLMEHGMPSRRKYFFVRRKQRYIL